MSVQTVEYGELVSIKSRSQRLVQLRIYSALTPRKIVVFLHGFQRSTAEHKFKKLAEELAARHIASVGIDLGVALSADEYLATYSIAQRVQDVHDALAWLGREKGWHVSGFVGHSLGACVVLETVRRIMATEGEKNIPAIVLLAPALNQAMLIRYFWYRRKKPQTTWYDFMRGWKEDDSFEDRMHEMAELLPAVAEAATQDFCPETARYQHPSPRHERDALLMVLGANDTIVPSESFTVLPRYRITVRGGDHDLEQPAMMEQWFGYAVQHLANETSDEVRA